jgi:hypothetical protein
MFSTVNASFYHLDNKYEVKNAFTYSYQDLNEKKKLSLIVCCADHPLNYMYGIAEPQHVYVGGKRCI